MSHPRDNELYPKGTKAIWTIPSHRVNPKVVEVVIKNHAYQFNGRSFLNYQVEILSEPGKVYAAYHGDLKIVK